MSVPAPDAGFAPAPAPKRPATPARTTAARPRTAIPPQGHRRARRGLHPTFLLFATTIVVLLVVGVVAVNALFAQTAFAVHATQSRVADLQEQHAVLATDAARLSSPGRIADWAAHYQMVLPQAVVILHIPAKVAGDSP